MTGHLDRFVDEPTQPGRKYPLGLALPASRGAKRIGRALQSSLAMSPSWSEYVPAMRSAIFLDPPTGAARGGARAA